MKVTAVQLERAAADLGGTAHVLEAAAGRHAHATRALERATEAIGSSWVSVASERFVTDQRRVVAATGRVAARLLLAAERTRTLASTAATLASGLRDSEYAYAAATASLQDVARRRFRLGPGEDAARAVADDQGRAERSQRVARANLEAGAQAWDRACVEAAATVRLAAELIRDDGPAADPLATRTTDDLGVFSAVDALATTEQWVKAPTIQGPVDVHGLFLAGQQLPATTTLLQAWARRGLIGAAAVSQHRITALDEVVESAADVARRGSGVVRRVGPAPGVLGAVGDAFTLASGSEYEGSRGTADRGMSGVGLVSAGVLGAAGIVAVSPVVLGAAVVGATATTVWGLGNLAYDHRDAVGRAGRSVRSGVSRAGSAIASGARSTLSAIGDAFGSGGGR